MQQNQVLVVGYRPQIAARLNDHDIPFVIWHDKIIKKRRVPGCSRIIQDVPFYPSKRRIKEQLAELFDAETQFNHVIAGTEASVVTASVARRAFGSRKSIDTVVLRCHNKRLMKEFLFNNGIPIIPFIYSGDKTVGPSLTPQKIVDRLGLPVVVKQLNNSGGRGLFVANNPDDLEPFLSQRVLFEKFVDAPEASVETFISEFQVRFASMTQYVEKRHVNLVPSGHNDELNHRVFELNRQVLDHMKIKWGLTHAEYYLAGDQIYFGEIALRPPGGYIMDLISMAYNFDAWNAFVDNELGIRNDFPVREIQWSAATMFHPGAGTIESIKGADAVKSTPECKAFNLLSKQGTTLAPRSGSGEVAAYALFSSDSKNTTLDAVANAQRQLIFNMRSDGHSNTASR